MTTTKAITTAQQAAPVVNDPRSLDELAAEVRRLHLLVLNSYRAGLDYAHEAGKVLTLAKEKFNREHPKLRWESWVEMNCSDRSHPGWDK